jgi:hypothetical protein
VRSAMAFGIGLIGFASACGVERPPPHEAPRADAESTPRLPESVEAALAEAEIELLSLRPVASADGAPNSFHGWSILGRTTLGGSSLGREVIASVRQGVAASDGSVALCFEPRHGIRARSSTGTVDLVICFACMRMEAYLNDKSLEDGGGPHRLDRFRGLSLCV